MPTGSWIWWAFSPVCRRVGSEPIVSITPCVSRARAVAMQTGNRAPSIELALVEPVDSNRARPASEGCTASPVQPSEPGVLGARRESPLPLVGTCTRARAAGSPRARGMNPLVTQSAPRASAPHRSRMDRLDAQCIALAQPVLASLGRERGTASIAFSTLDAVIVPRSNSRSTSHEHLDAAGARSRSSSRACGGSRASQTA